MAAAVAFSKDQGTVAASPKGKARTRRKAPVVS